MSFTEDFSIYENCVPPGVRLPKIEIETRHYDRLELDHKTSNYDFLRALCLDGVKEKRSIKRKTLKHIMQEFEWNLRS